MRRPDWALFLAFAAIALYLAIGLYDAQQEELNEKSTDICCGIRCGCSRTLDAPGTFTAPEMTKGGNAMRVYKIITNDGPVDLRCDYVEVDPRTQTLYIIVGDRVKRAFNSAQWKEYELISEDDDAKD